MRHQFEVNSLGPLRVAAALVGNMVDQKSKFFIVSSRVGSVGDNGRGGIYGYRMSKSAVNMAGKNLAIEWKDRGIAVGLLHPGYVKTNMTGNAGNITAKESAAGLIKQMDRLQMDQTGTFWHMDGTELPW